MTNIIDRSIENDQRNERNVHWINENLKAVLVNQAVIHCRLSEIENEIGKSDPVGEKD